MAEKETVFSSKMKYNGIFPFSNFYKFCYEWLTAETGLKISEDKYAEKLIGTSKDIEIEWTGTRKLTDYFKLEAKVKFRILALTNVDIDQNGVKVSTNKGSVEVGIKGIIVKDYEGKFETTGFRKFLRSVYEKWIIPSVVDEFETKIIEDCDEFLGQAKAYLDLEGKK